MTDDQGGELRSRAVRGMHEPGDDPQLVRWLMLAERAQDIGRGVERMGDQAADDLSERVQAVLEPGGDAEVPAPSAKRPEEVGMRLFADVEHLTFCGHELNGQQVVDREAVDSFQPAEPAAQREARDPCRRDPSAGCGEPVEERLLVELAPAHAYLSPHRTCIRVDVDALHFGEVDHEAAVCDGPAGDAVPSTADGDLEARFARKRDRVNDVPSAATACD